MRTERELPVVWAVAKGSAFNKMILVPSALALSYVLPWLITPLLMIGGAFLSYEGFEKILHSLAKKPPQDDGPTAEEKLNALREPDVDVVALEKEKIKGAIRTDFILSAEIVVITLGTVQDQPFALRASVVTGMAVVLTIGVYALVAAIVKMDDFGLLLLERKGGSEWSRKVGAGVLWVAPRFLRVLSLLGTVAMFLVGGGILVHGVTPFYEAVHGATERIHHLPTVGALFAALVPTLINAVVGLATGALLVGAHHVVARAFSRRKTPA